MISAHLFGCSTAGDRGTCDNRINIRRDVLEAAVLDGLRTKLMDPDLFKVFVQELTTEVNRQRSSQRQQQEATRSELINMERRIRRLVEAIAAGVNALALKDEVMGLERRQAELERQIAIREDPSPLLHPRPCRGLSQEGSRSARWQPTAW